MASLPHAATEAQPPRRIQRKRTKGWRMPEGAVYVGRPTRWGNPYNVTGWVTPAMVVLWYRGAILEGYTNAVTPAEIRTHLAGHDLACWCPLDQPCHADVLLELANGGAA